MRQRMCEETLIVPGRKIGALVRAARLFSLEPGTDDRLGDVEHEREFEGGDALGVERRAAVLDRDVAGSLLQLMHLVHRVFERRARSIDPRAPLHGLLHRLPQISDPCAALAVEQIVLETPVLIGLLRDDVRVDVDAP